MSDQNHEEKGLIGKAIDVLTGHAEEEVEESSDAESTNDKTPKRKKKSRASAEAHSEIQDHPKFNKFK